MASFNVSILFETPPKILVASIMTAFVLTGCNTFKGIGKDVSKAGDKVTQTAERTQDKM